jgi:hypothetical protein
VKVNRGKIGDLLAEVKAVTGRRGEESPRMDREGTRKENHEND